MSSRSFEKWLFGKWGPLEKSILSWGKDVVWPEDAFCCACGRISDRDGLCAACRDSLMNDGALFAWDRADPEPGLAAWSLRPHEGTLKRAGIDLEGNIWYHRGFLSAQDKTRMLGGMATAYASLAFGRVDLDVRVSGGGGRWLERGNTYGPNDESVRLAEDWARNMDYRMLPRVGAGGTFTYRAAFLEGLSFQLCGDLVHAFKMVHLGGKNRETATLRVGYHF